MSKELATKQETAIQAEQPMSEATSLIQAIERAALNPAVDVDKMERLLQMQERIIGKQAEAAFNAAMTAAQQEMRPVSADAENPQTRSRYATYAKLDSKLRPIYNAKGFSVSFNTNECPIPDHMRIVAYVAHSMGHSKTYQVDMPSDGKGAKGGDVMTKTHAAGAAMSYGMRYLLKMIFNVAVGEDDSDGNPPAERITEEQELNIIALAEEVGANKAAFLKFFKIKEVAELRADRYKDAVSMLESKRKKS